MQRPRHSSQEAYLASLQEQREAKIRSQAEDRLRDRAANLAHMANDPHARGGGTDPFLAEQEELLQGEARQLGVNIDREPPASSAQAAMQQAATPLGSAMIVAGEGNFSHLFAPSAPAPVIRTQHAAVDTSGMSARERAWEQKRLARLAKHAQEGVGTTGRKEEGREGSAAHSGLVGSAPKTAREAAFDAKLRARKERQVAGDQPQSHNPNDAREDTHQYQHASQNPGPRYEQSNCVPYSQEQALSQQHVEPSQPHHFQTSSQQYQHSAPQQKPPHPYDANRPGRIDAAVDDRYNGGPQDALPSQNVRQQQEGYASALLQQQLEKEEKAKGRNANQDEGGDGVLFPRVADLPEDPRRRRQQEYASDLQQQVVEKQQRGTKDRYMGGGGGAIVFGGGDDDGDASRHQKLEYAAALEQQKSERETRERESRERRMSTAGDVLGGGYDAEGIRRRQQQEYAAALEQQMAAKEQRNRQDHVGGGGNIFGASGDGSDARRRQQQEYAAALDQQKSERERRERESRERRMSTAGDVLGGGDDVGEIRRRQQQEYAAALEQQMAADGKRDGQGQGGDVGDRCGASGEGSDARRRQQQEYA
ncbi:MAG: hypothetical protein SGPRY_005134, partial [Prymnesium sp.]